MHAVDWPHELSEQLFGAVPDLHVIPPGESGTGSRYVVRQVRGAASLARQAGLLDARGRVVRGLAPWVVSGGVCDAAAAWRGAFLARGSLTEPGRCPVLEVTSPGLEAALALVGAGRRLGITATAREAHRADQVVVGGGAAIAVLLTRLRADTCVLAWEQRRTRRPVRAKRSVPNFDAANQRRATGAAAVRVARALELLGDDARPTCLLRGGCGWPTGRCPWRNWPSSPTRLITKDTIGGRIRRLLAIADTHAHDLQVPDTSSALPPETLDG